MYRQFPARFKLWIWILTYVQSTSAIAPALRSIIALLKSLRSPHSDKQFNVLLIELFSSYKPTQAAELQKHNEDLIQEMDRVMTQLEMIHRAKTDAASKVFCD